MSHPCILLLSLYRLKGWITEANPICGEFAYALHMHVTSLHPVTVVCKQIVNFTVFYPDDSSSGPHCLSLDNYNIDADSDSPNHIWLLIELSNP